MNLHELNALYPFTTEKFDVNSAESGDFGSSLFHNAIRYGQMEVFNYLIEKGANQRGATAKILAMKFGQDAFLEFLQ